MSIYYFDSSALIKRYHYELGTDVVDRIIENEDSEIYVSSISLIEVISTLRRKVKAHKITKAKFVKLKGAFLYEISHAFTLIPIDESIIVDAVHIAEKYGTKSLDSIHLASALRLKNITSNPIFVSSDKELIKYAYSEGFKIINPEAP